MENSYTVVVHFTRSRWWHPKKVVIKDAVGVRWLDKSFLVVGRVGDSSATFSQYEVAWVEENK